MTINTNYTYDVSAKALIKENYNRELPSSLNSRTIHNGIIIPYLPEAPNLAGEVINEQGLLVEEVNSLSTYEELKNVATLHNEISTIQKLPIQHEPTTTIYLGTIPVCWGHYFTDGLSKVWYFYKNTKADWENHNICYTTPYYNIDKTPSSFIELLCLVIGDNTIANKIKPLQQATKFDTLIIPDNSLLVDHQHCSRHYTALWNDTIDILIHNTLKKNNHYKTFPKIYLSRTKLSNKVAEFGELSIEKAFKAAGFYIVHPERIPFAEQLHYLQTCNTLATTEGSLGHNTVFCKPGTDVILLRKAWMQYDYQFCINQMRNLNVTYIDIHLSIFVTDNPNLGPFFLYRTDEFCRFLNDRFNLKISNNFSRKKIMQYAELCMKKNDFYHRHDCPEELYTYLNIELSKNISIVRKLLKSFYSKLNNTQIKTFIKSILYYFTR